MLLQDLVPVSWAGIYLYFYNKSEYLSKIIDYRKSMSKSIYLQYLGASCCHFNFFHLYSNIKSWNCLTSTKISFMEMLSLQIIGGTVSVAICHFLNPTQLVIGGSGGIIAGLMYAGLKNRNLMIVYNPTIIPIGGKWFPLYQVLSLNICLDFMGELLFNKYSLASSYKQLEWWLKNFNTFRLGSPNVSGTGHLIGGLVGIACYGVYRLVNKNKKLQIKQESKSLLDDISEKMPKNKLKQMLIGFVIGIVLHKLFH